MPITQVLTKADEGKRVVWHNPDAPADAAPIAGVIPDSLVPENTGPGTDAMILVKLETEAGFRLLPRADLDWADQPEPDKPETAPAATKSAKSAH